MHKFFQLPRITISGTELIYCYILILLSRQNVFVCAIDWGRWKWWRISTQLLRIHKGRAITICFQALNWQKTQRLANVYLYVWFLVYHSPFISKPFFLPKIIQLFFFKKESSINSYAFLILKDLNYTFSFGVDLSEHNFLKQNLQGPSLCRKIIVFPCSFFSI